MPAHNHRYYSIDRILLITAGMGVPRFYKISKLSHCWFYIFYLITHNNEFLDLFEEQCFLWRATKEIFLKKSSLCFKIYVTFNRQMIPTKDEVIIQFFNFYSIPQIINWEYEVDEQVLVTLIVFKLFRAIKVPWWPSLMVQP